MRFVLAITMFIIFASGEGGILKVDWSNVSEKQKRYMKPHPKELREKIRDVRLPVYLPSGYIHNRMSIVGDKNFYSITIFLKGATLLVSGDRTYQKKIESNKKELKTKFKAVNAKFIRAEGIMSTSFNRHGVNYSLSVECDKPNRDKRCKEETFLRDIYNKLVVVGGRR